MKNVLVTAAVCGVSSVFSMASPANAALVAQWDFSGTTAGQALSATVGGYTLAERNTGGSGQTIAYNGDGTISLGNGKQVYATTFNSANLPTLKQNATFYMRVRFDGAPANGGTFAGLITSSDNSAPSTYPASTGSTSALAAFTVSSTTAANYAKLTSGGTIAPASGFPTISSGTFHQIAIVFNDLSDISGAASTTKSQSRLYVDGVEVSREATGTVLASFNYLALGRVVTNNSAGPMTFDQVKIFDEALTTAQINALIPEPASLGLLALAGMGLLRRRR